MMAATELAEDSRVRAGRVRRVAGSLWARALVTLVLVGIVASRIDWSTLSTRIRDGDPLDFAIGVLFVLASLAVGIYRWRRLLIGADINLPRYDIFRAYAVSIFTGTFLPTTLGGDVTRALLVTRRQPMLTKVAITVIVDRIGGLLGLIGIAWVGFVSDPGAVPHTSRVLIVWATAVVGLGLLLALVALSRRGGVITRLAPVRLESLARESHSLLRTYALKPSLILMLVSSSLLFQALVSLQLVFLGRAIGVHLPFATAAVALALVTIATLIPVSIGGFGVREGSYVVLLGAASIGATDATLISLLSVAALFLASLPGAYLLARRGVSPSIEGATT